MACCSFDRTVDQQFSARKVGKELDRYRRHGAGHTARMLLDGLAKVDLARATLLDVGGGVGAMTFALIERGVKRAVIVEASKAYLEAAATETTRRGLTDTVEVVGGDFLDVADRIPAATVVTLDRVICCYPMYAELLAETLSHAERLFAYSYPRDRWYVRAAVRGENWLRGRKSRFRTFVHPEAAMQRLIEDAGFRLVSHAHTLSWSGDVFARVR
jgi:cyclopropane fatty-acyl-phospholipid synthase-like methyltransferase